MSTELINPPELARPKGYSHAAAGRGKTVALAGQIGWDASSKLVSAEHGRAVRAGAGATWSSRCGAAGGKPEHLLSLRMYVTDKHKYNACLKEIGASYRLHLGRHFPAMALVQVADCSSPARSSRLKDWPSSRTEIEEPTCLRRRASATPLNDGIATITLDRPDRSTR